jgi:hypothetical protein
VIYCSGMTKGVPRAITATVLCKSTSLVEATGATCLFFLGIAAPRRCITRLAPIVPGGHRSFRCGRYSAHFVLNADPEGALSIAPRLMAAALHCREPGYYGWGTVERFHFDLEQVQ